MAKKKQLSDREIVDQTNGLARLFYNSLGYVVPEGYRFDKAHHPQERGMWNQACIAQEFLTGTNPGDALAGIEQRDES